MIDNKTGTGPANLRASERVDYEVSVDMESESNFFTGLVRNISEGGLFVLADNQIGRASCRERV